MKPIDITGRRFGRLVAIRQVGSTEQGNAIWLCKCDCGKETEVRSVILRNGVTKSCGCYRSEYQREQQTKHGKSTTRMARIWYNMKERCLNRNNTSFANYGGRGITVCKEWLADFDNFYRWAICNGYRDDLTIDRINVNGNYEPNNCRWIPKGEQSRNRRPSSEWKFKRKPVEVQ